MTTRYYHTPPPPVSTRVRCPVCHEAVYSRGNIHPQCAVHQSEGPEPKGKALAVPTNLEPAIRPVEVIGAAVLTKPALDDLPFVSPGTGRAGFTTPRPAPLSDPTVPGPPRKSRRRP